MRFTRPGRKDQDNEGRNSQQSGDKVQAPDVATGLLADHANHHRADKATEIADGVNRGDTSGKNELQSTPGREEDTYCVSPGSPLSVTVQAATLPPEPQDKTVPPLRRGNKYSTRHVRIVILG